MRPSTSRLVSARTRASAREAAADLLAAAVRLCAHVPHAAAANYLVHAALLPWTIAPLAAQSQPTGANTLSPLGCLERLAVHQQTAHPGRPSPTGSIVVYVHLAHACSALTHAPVDLCVHQIRAHRCITRAKRAPMYTNRPMRAPRQ